MKTQLTLVSVAVLLLAGCDQPTPPCLVFRASGGTYTAEFVNGAITTTPVTAPNCAFFSTEAQQGAPAILFGACANTPGIACWCDDTGDPCTSDADCSEFCAQGTVSVYQYNIVGGFPFRASLVGVDKFAPATTGGASKVSIAPEIFYTGTGQAGFVIGDLLAENPDAQNLCYVPDLGTTTGEFDWGYAGPNVAPKTVTMEWKNMTIYETGGVQGTQFTAEVTATIADDAAGTNPCTATYNVLAVAPSTTCVVVDDNGVANGGQAPFGANQVQPNLCTDATVQSQDPVWINYGNNAFLTGNAVNPSFPIVCDEVSGYCVLPPPVSGPPTLPVLIPNGGSRP